MNKRKKISFIIPSLRGGGAERQISEIANYFDEADYEIIFITFENSLNDVYKLNNDIKRIVVPFTWKGNKFFRSLGNIKLIFFVRNILKDEKPNVVISFLIYTNIITILAKRGLGIKTIVSERNNPVKQKISFHWNLARKLLYKHSDIVIAQTKYIQNWLSVNCKANVQLIPNHIRNLPNPHKIRTPIIVSVGRLHKVKGFDLLIQAFSEVSKDFPQWKLQILGEGQERYNLEKLIEDLNLTGKVEMPGHVNNIEEWFDKAGLVVQFSRYEGFPNVLLEAMSMGAPVISSNCFSGPSDIIKDGINGKLVPTENVVTLAQTMKELLTDKQKSEELGKFALKIRDIYARDKIMQKWERLLSK